MKKRIISVMLSALLLASLGGCGKEAQQAETGSVTQAEEGAESRRKRPMSLQRERRLTESI